MASLNALVALVYLVESLILQVSRYNNPASIYVAKDSREGLVHHGLSNLGGDC